MLQITIQSTPPVRGRTIYPGTFASLPSISIHPPGAGWDVLGSTPPSVIVTFQSTHPVRGGTCLISRRSLPAVYFNPPTPCGVGLAQNADALAAF